MESMCVNTRYINVDMVGSFFTYPNRCIYCAAGCIYSCFLDMDSEAEEGQCGVLYRVACPLCIVYSNVLDVVAGVLLYDKWVIQFFEIMPSAGDWYCIHRQGEYDESG